MTAAHLADGRRAEDIARRELEAQGLSHLRSNFRCRLGEIDLIMRDGDCLVIIEVRYRRSGSHGGALGSVTPRKQRRIVGATRLLLKRYPHLGDLSLRFDVIALSGTLDKPRVDWRKRAFDCSPD